MRRAVQGRTEARGVGPRHCGKYDRVDSASAVTKLESLFSADFDLEGWTLSECDSATELLDQLAHEFVERLRRGEQPTAEQFAASHPELAHEIRELFPTLQWMEQVSTGAPSGSTRRGRMADDAPCPGQLAEYRVVRRIGRGGMGTVYEAVQEPLGRRVALKVLSLRAADRGTLLERFRREVKTAANLHHTNIVPVFGVGESDGVHFYAMQYIDGQPLDKILAEAISGKSVAAPAALAVVDPCYYRAVARLGVQAADALAHAHGEGVLHRDVKPANMLLDSHGTLWVTDFGLARIEGSSELTVAEDVVGTLRYVPPERLEGRTDALGDVYSLGLTLYEFLTRRPAFEWTTRAELVNHILNRPIVRPRQIDRRIPRDLETIVLKAISREPEHRYRSSVALAEDLRRYLADRPVLARRLTAVERSWRWCRKNKMMAGVSMLAFLMMLTTACVSTVAFIRERSLMTDVRRSLRLVEAAETQSRRELFASYVSAAKLSQVSRRQGQRFDSLATIRKAVRLLPAMLLTGPELQVHRDQLRDLAISALALPDIRESGEYPASGFALDQLFLDRSVEHLPTDEFVIREWPAGTELDRLSHADQQTVFAFTPDRNTFLLLDPRRHTLERWQSGTTTRTPVAQLRKHKG
ncbi:MAG: serine/threonine-protein kinase, partial [Pirellulaceae bacterium]